MRSSSCAATTLLTVMLCSPAALAVDIYVDADASGLGSGSSWDNAFTDLRLALMAAQGSDVVRIAQGTYRPGGPGDERSLTFEIPDRVRVIGGYAGAGEPDPDAFDPDLYVTILSGDLNGNDGPAFANNTDNSFHVVTAVNTHAGTTLRGVTVTAGNANDSQPVGTAGMGGGIACIGGTLAIRDCIIEDNSASRSGGGIASALGALAIHMRDCTVRGNIITAFTGTGGGVVAGPNSTFTDCLFQDNFVLVGSIGGALRVSDATIERCTFLDNTAGDLGGAVLGHRLNILDSVFTGNVSGADGGALCLGGECLVRNCVFDDNSAMIGGAIWHREEIASDTFAVVECDFIGNSAEFAGAIRARSPIDIVNCRFLSNAADSGSAGSTGFGGAVHADEALLAVNCLFSGNTSEHNGASIRAEGTTTLVNCTLVYNQANLQGGTFQGGAVAAAGIFNLRNCILWGNTGASAEVQAQQLSDAGDPIFRVRHSIVEGWTGDLGGGATNNGNDPQMVDPDGADDTIGTTDDNPRLGVGSPARNTGRNDFLPRDDFDLDGDSNLNERVSEDVAGNRRIRASTVDRGAYESTGS